MIDDAGPDAAPSETEAPAEDGPDDAALAAQCAAGDADAGEALLRRCMGRIYRFPGSGFLRDRRLPEEMWSDFLLYAVERIRSRNIFGAYDPSRGRFATWLGAVLHNLLVDYYRAHKDDPRLLPLEPAVAPPAKGRRPGDDHADAASELVERLSLKCRALFKLLLLAGMELEPEEVRYIAAQARKPVVVILSELSRLEDDLCEKSRELEEKQQSLSTAHYWVMRYERELDALDRDDGDAEEIASIRTRLEQRRRQHARIAKELAASHGVATMRYGDMADLLDMKEGTLGSHLTRCRKGMADLVDETDGEGSA